MFNINVGLCPILSQRQRDRRVNILWQVSWYAWWLRRHCGTGKSVAISGPSKNESMFCGDLPWKKWPSWRRYARYLQWIGPLKWPCQAARRLDKCWGSLEHHEVQQPLISSSPNILFWLVVAANPSEKWWSSSVGMMKFPTEWGKKNMVLNHQPVFISFYGAWFQTYISWTKDGMLIHHFPKAKSLVEAAEPAWEYGQPAEDWAEEIPTKILFIYKVRGTQWDNFHEHEVRNHEVLCYSNIQRFFCHMCFGRAPSPSTDLQKMCLHVSTP